MLECTITETKDIEPIVYEWGAVKWVANRDLNPGCEQSFGLAHILPGKVNPEHWHTAVAGGLRSRSLMSVRSRSTR
jgi:hypothetical protein